MIKDELLLWRNIKIQEDVSSPWHFTSLEWSTSTVHDKMQADHVIEKSYD